MPVTIDGYIKRIFLYFAIAIPAVLILVFARTYYAIYLPTVVREIIRDHYSIILAIYLLFVLFMFLLYKFWGVFFFGYMQKKREEVKEKAEIRDMRLGVNRQ